jgi:ribonucleoside-triphosphate reductase (thioredoxin)
VSSLCACGDLQVSCTVTFDPEKEGPQLSHALDWVRAGLGKAGPVMCWPDRSRCVRLLQFQYELKGISFLPRMEMGAYPQMPYEEISEEQYRQVHMPSQAPLP